MRILKWNIDKENATFACRVNKAVPNRIISYQTLNGEKITLKASAIRKQPKFNVRNGHVVEAPSNLK